MAEVIEDINSNPDLEIEIISECDSICQHCPHNVEGICQKKPGYARKTRDMDMYVLAKIDLKGRSRGKAKNIFSIVNAKLRDNSDVQRLCGGCSWKEKCLWFISRKESTKMEGERKRLGILNTFRTFYYEEIVGFKYKIEEFNLSFAM
jgi:hypothetical protein